MIAIFMIIVGFGLTVFIHELGHFLVARWCGVRVEVFCIGMGPRLFKLYKDSKGTEYIIALLPLGGYVKLLGQEDMPKKKLNRTKYPKGHYLSASPYKRLAIVVAGVIMNVILAYFLIVAAFYIGIPFSNNRVGSIDDNNSVFDTSALKMGDEIIAVNGESVNTWEELQTKVVLLKEKDVLALTVLRDGNTLPINVTNVQAKTNKKKELSFLGIRPYQPAVVYLSDGKEMYDEKNKQIKNGTTILKVSFNKGDIVKKTPLGIYRTIKENVKLPMNLLLLEENGERWYSNVNLVTTKIFDKGYRQRVVVDMLDDGAAKNAGLQNGDEIITINNKPMRGWQDVVDFFALFNGPTPLQVKVKRDNEELFFSIQPDYNRFSERYILGVMPSKTKEAMSREVSYISDELNQLDNSLRVGDEIVSYVKRNKTHHFRVKRGEETKQIALSQLVFPLVEKGDMCRLKSGEKVVSYALPLAFVKAVPQLWRELEEVYLSLNRLITGNIPLDMLGGPVRIFEISYTIANQKGLAYFILLFAKLGISLAILNILPIPVLDGGHVVFIVYEIIFKRPVNEKVAYVTHIIGFALLMTLFVFVFYNDIRSIILR